ncbi:MAG: hypothetical protein R3C14_51045 [Caldilineaceae bacterium]
MTQLALYLFGPPRVAVDGVERYIRRRKTVTLLSTMGAVAGLAWAHARREAATG